MRDLFKTLGPSNITVHVMLDLQERYPDLDKDELYSYKKRVYLRVSMLTKFATKHQLPAGTDLVLSAIQDVDKDLLRKTCDELNITAVADKIAPAPDKQVILMNGGPATGKSGRIKALDLPADTIILDRDAIFEHLPPYPRLKNKHPDKATHAVVCEAILYNERDAYRYAILSGASHILVDGTMSYLDLGLEMIEFAQQQGYHVTVISMDCPIEDALKRALARAEKAGKTINSKLLYESHVRCAYNFFKYKEKADSTENWSNSGERPPRKTASSRKKADGTIEEVIEDETAIQSLREKSTLPLDNPSWPPNFDEFLTQR